MSYYLSWISNKNSLNFTTLLTGHSQCVCFYKCNQLHWTSYSTCRWISPLTEHAFQKKLKFTLMGIWVNHTFLHVTLYSLRGLTVMLLFRQGIFVGRWQYTIQGSSVIYHNLQCLKIKMAINQRKYYPESYN